MNEIELIRNFAKIAQHSEDNWSHNRHYHQYLLRHLPRHKGSALDIGSGLGQFSRMLAEHFESVVGIDFSPKMVEGAIARSSSIGNLRFQCVDFLQTEFPENCFDCVASIAAMHHLPFRLALEKTQRILKNGGRLLILDLFKNRNIPDYLFSGAGAIANALGSARRRENKNIELKKAWAEHAALDDLLTIRDVENSVRDMLPGAVVRRHIYFRYSLIWEKP